MRVERPHQCVAPVNRYAGSDAVIGEARATDAERQRVLEGLEPRQKSIRINHDPRTHCGRARPLKVADRAVEIDAASLSRCADPDVRVDNHHGLDVLGKPQQELVQRTGLAPIGRLVDAAPARLPQAFDGVIGGAVADQPDTLAMRRKDLRELIEFLFEIEDRRDDGIRLDGHDERSIAPNGGAEIDRQIAIVVGDRRRSGVAPAHIESQQKIEGVGIYDEVGQSVNEQ